MQDNSLLQYRAMVSTADGAVSGDANTTNKGRKSNVKIEIKDMIIYQRTFTKIQQMTGV